MTLTPWPPTGHPQYYFESCISGNTTPTLAHTSTDHRLPPPPPLPHNWTQSTTTLSAKHRTPPPTPPIPTTPRMEPENHKKIGNKRNLQMPPHICHKENKSATEPSETTDIQKKQVHKNGINLSITRSDSSGSLDLLSEEISKLAYNSISDRPPCQLPDSHKSSGSHNSDLSCLSPTPVTTINTLPHWKRPGQKQKLRTSNSGTYEHYVNEGMGPPNTKFHNKETVLA